MAIRVPIPAHEEADDHAEGTEAATAVAFEDLWQHRAALRDLCQRIVGDAATADDVVQETYLRALRNLDRLEQRPSLMPWLATVARRRSIDELRRRQYQRPVEILPDDSTKPEHDPGEAAGVSETVQRVREALTALTDRERELLMKQVNQGLSLAQLAEADESSVASVRSVLSRARTKLRDALADTGARVLAPLGLAGAWFKRSAERLGDLSNRAEASVKHKAGAVNLKAQRVSFAMPGGYERMAEVATVTAVAGALAIGGMLPSLVQGPGDGEPIQTAIAGAPAAAEGEAGSAATGDPSSMSEQASAPSRTTGGEKASTAADTPSRDGDAPSSSPNPASGPLVPGAVPQPGPVGPPPEPGNPTPPPEDPPEQPSDAYIDDIAFAGEGYSSQTSNEGTVVYALGHYSATECTSESCDVLFRSDDGGGTWSKMAAAGLDADSIMVSSANADLLFAMGTDGLFRSTNGGRTFSRVLAQSGPAAISPDGSAHGRDSIFIGAAPFWDYDISDDQTSVMTVTGVLGATASFAFSPDFSTDGLVFAGGKALGAGGVATPSVHACSADSNATDCTDSVTLPGATKPPVVAVSSTHGDDGLVFAWDDSRFWVSEGDLEFDQIDLGLASGTIGGITDDGAGTFFLALDGGGTDGVLKSRNRGRTWTRVGTATVLGDGARSVVALGEGRLLASPKHHKGLLCSSDGGSNWSPAC